MVDPLESSWRKIARAKEHFADLERKISEFIKLQPYARVVEPHPEEPAHQIYKLRLTQPLPELLSEITGDVVHNLRSALDQAAYAVAVASGRTNPKCTAFPFAGSIAQMGNALGRSKDLPDQIQSLFCGFLPYRGGDDLLWALNEISITDKHKILSPMGVGVIRSMAKLKATCFFSMPNPHFWDKAKNEMELFTVGPPAGDFKYEFDFTLFVAFNEIQVVEGEPVLGILGKLGSKVESILVGIEAEARRLGYVV